MNVCIRMLHFFYTGKSESNPGHTLVLLKLKGLSLQSLIQSLHFTIGIAHSCVSILAAVVPNVD